MAGVVNQLGEAEVQDLRHTLASEHHVLGLQIAVDDSGVVGTGQAICDLCGDGNEATNRQWTIHQHIAQRPTGDELHGDV